MKSKKQKYTAYETVHGESESLEHATHRYADPGKVASRRVGSSECGLWVCA